MKNNYALVAICQSTLVKQIRKLDRTIDLANNPYIQKSEG